MEIIVMSTVYSGVDGVFE